MSERACPSPKASLDGSEGIQVQGCLTPCGTSSLEIRSNGFESKSPELESVPPSRKCQDQGWFQTVRCKLDF